ncbi:ICOS ligand-like isoform X2 [Scyliorhinus canicula]|nr:ICOS ligand-like isoform X2 [Scyliorhinus canicula]
MKLFLCLILSACLHPVWSDSVTGMVGSPIILPCFYKQEAINPHSSLRLFWQVNKQVVYNYKDGRSDPTYQDDKYKGRVMASDTAIRNGNLSLQINNLTIPDENDYTCYFMIDNKNVLQSLVRLQIAANFSLPLMSAPRPQDIQLGEEVNFTCRSSGGYPKPVLNWIDAKGDSLPRGNQGNTTTQSDPASGLWSVTSVLRINITQKSTFLCSVFNSRTQETRSSGQWTYIRNDPLEGTTHPQHLIVVYAVVAGLICLTVLVPIIIFSLKKRRGVYTTGVTMDETQAHITSTELQCL